MSSDGEDDPYEGEQEYDQDAGFNDEADSDWQPTPAVNYPEHLKNEKFDDEEDIDAEVEMAIAKAAEKQRKEAKPVNMTDALFGVEHAEENLGDDFEDTPWVPPTVERALEFRAHHVFRGGNAYLRTLNITSVADLGAAVPLYFQFVKSMAIALFFMTLLAAPALLFSFEGSRIPLEDQDGLGLYQFSIGNIGYDSTDSQYANDSACTGNSVLGLDSLPLISSYVNFTSPNQTCVHVMGMEFTNTETGIILMLCELLQIAIFFTVTIYLHDKAQHFREKTEGKICAISDFSIVVRGLPSDTTQEQLISHFSKLYPLDRPDWRGRPPVLQARPVEHCDNTGESIHIGSWVAECIVHKRIGTFIKAFRSKQHLMEKLYKSRAEMKMYGPNSCLQQGGNPKKYARAERRMLAAGAQLDTFTEKMAKRRGMKLSTHKIVATEDTEEDGGLSPSSPHPISSQSHASSRSADSSINADAVAGFIVFEYCESFARCLEDYTKYNHFPYSWFVPNKLKFRGHRITVRKAPEPDEIVWENLEVSRFTKIRHRIRTNIVTIILVLICFVIILQAAIYRQRFKSSLPDLSLCNTEIPALFVNSYQESDVSRVSLMRPPATGEQVSMDVTCQNIVPNSFYGMYVWDEDYTQPVRNYTTTACYGAGNAVDVCPIPSHTQELCPCVLSQSSSIQSTDCSTLKCYEQDAIANNQPPPNDDDAVVPGTRCLAFDASLIGACYCQSELENIIKSGSVMDSISRVREQAYATSSVCTDFFINYSLSSGLTYMAILVSAVINFFLRKALKLLTRTESHMSVDEEQGSLMYKIFIAIYFNIALVVILAFGRIDNMPDMLKPTQIFMGTYSDFTLAWYVLLFSFLPSLALAVCRYGTIGSLFIGSMVIQSLSPLMSPLYQYYISKPYKRLCYYPAVMNQSSTRFAMQHELDMLEVGPIFDATIQSANLLALLFFGMTFAAGLPLMVPLLFLIFTVYFYVDRMLLCYYYQRPPRVGDGVIKLVCKLLPYAALIRLAFASWMFSQPQVLIGNKEVNVLPVNASLIEYCKTRLSVANVVPLIAVLVLVLVMMLLRRVWKQLPFYWLYRCFAFVYQRTRKQTRMYTDENGFLHPYDTVRGGDSLRQESSPFTGDYMKFLKDKQEIPDTCGKICTHVANADVALTDQEIDQGFIVMDYKDDDRYIVKTMVWAKTASMNGVLRREGDYKRTYEVINALGGLSSYALDRVPAYKLTMMGLKEGINNLMQYQAQKRAGMHKAASIRDILATMEQGESVLDKYNQKQMRKAKAKAEAENWGLNKKTLTKEEKAKQKRTAREKNEAASSDHLYGGGGAHGEEEAEDEDDSESEEEEEEYGFGGPRRRGEEEEEADGDDGEDDDDSDRLV